MKRTFSRRAVLRGAGVVLTLPYLPSLVRPARAQAAPEPKRFVPIYLPNGAPELWQPLATGSGSAWQLSSVLEPLGALKSQVTLISGLENGSVFNADGSSSVEPSHGRLSGAWLTSTDPGAKRHDLGVGEANGVSVDQVMAQHDNFVAVTAIPSLQVGLSSCLSYCDGQPCSNSRSVSWSAETTPLYKTVDPTTLFEQLVGVWPGTVNQLLQQRKSVLDGVLESAAVARARLGSSDQARLDEFMDSVRGIEQQVARAAMSHAGCPPLPSAPNFPTVNVDSFRQNTDTYNKDAHAELMNRLVALALQCDLTRIVSYMLEDERSEFICDHVAQRVFTAEGSTLGTGVCGEWHGSGQSGSQDTYASIVHWAVAKVASLCQLLADVPEGDGSVLDHSVVYFAGCMHGANHAGNRLPALLVGGGGGRLKTDQHVDLVMRPMRDLYFTLMNGVYDMNVGDFGMDRTGATIAMIPELLA